MDTNIFIVYIKTVDIYSDIAKDVETRFDTSNYELDRPLPIEFTAMRAKKLQHLTDDNDENIKTKDIKAIV